jgi:hypothetical protein
MSIVSLVIAPTLASVFKEKNNSETGAANWKTEQSIKVTASKSVTANTIHLR